MRPTLARPDHADCAWRYPKHRGKLANRFLFSIAQNVAGLIFGKLCHTRPRAYSMSPALNGVLGVLLMGADNEVPWVAAWRVIALMPDKKTFWNRALYQLVCDAVRHHGAKPAISRWGFAALPLPAMEIRRGLYP